MTDRMKGCFVAFDRDIREDDVQHLVGAIRMLKGVSAVELEVSNPDDWHARQRVRLEVETVLQTVTSGLLSSFLFVPESKRDQVASTLEELAARVREKRQ